MHSSDHFPSAARPLRRKNILGLAGLALVAGSSAMLAFAPAANAAIVPNVDLATAATFSVLAGQTVTNTGDSTLEGNVGVSPGTAVTGFVASNFSGTGTIASTPVSADAQAALGTAYLDAKGRTEGAVVLDKTDLVGQTLTPGVYAGASKDPLLLNGRLVLDAQDDPNAVFIFQTDSTLITGSASEIVLIKGAKECNVFWQVGSSATLGESSTFVGNILALTSVSVLEGVTVHGRALAQEASVTLINDTFTQPTCEGSTLREAPGGTTTTTTTSTTVAPTPSSDAAPPSSDVGVTPTSAPGTPTSTPSPDVTIPATPGGGFGPSDTTPVTGFGTGTTNPAFDDTDITLPVTGTTTDGTAPLAAGALLIGVAALVIARRRTAA